MKRYRLTARAQMHGEIRETGYVFTLGEGETGPHKTVSAAAPEAQIADHIGGVGELRDVPLYEEISEEHDQAVTEAEAKALDEADAHAAACAARDAEQAKVAEETLKEDGPTIAEWVEAGYKAAGYPPDGYASRSTPEEIEAAIKAETPPAE